MGDQAIDTFRSCIPLFHALGDPARQDIILLLAETERLTVNEIADQSRLSRPAISHHLKILKDQGLVSIEQQGTKRFYSLALEDSVTLLKKLIILVEETCI
ncbi:metalloregulator ArsR/SmtB family transcription factor [Metabacillus idriensis]|uniref:Metalloregulator ArsR/SmtB family transcription factor n=1 Tax=Metabacillus idriensis TaxID=324768 RepID=A0A6I2M7A2_9BACI|nr:metalloregulator ArsR/SmtB family transcription factor [Metabacillus idriensis]MCM3597366.1 metalloregulator ArsR/SmtB family transcription factor [Metabacillus idriensis]MRX54115.1 metalloregulator ArsR/SmtB family transcription factor [Metabacillus idriensis]OHR73282.1 transcriptional regulator [Bacillus sp. HMSC76G11]